MHKLAYVLLLLSFLVGCARLFTGVIYLSGEPTAVLVLKRAPAVWIERPETRDLQVSEQIVLDRKEPSLFLQTNLLAADECCIGPRAYSGEYSDVAARPFRTAAASKRS